MSWAEPSDDMDTLSELPPTGSSSIKSHKVSRSAPSKSSRRVGGASKSERRLLMEAKAGVGAAIAEERQERMIAKRRARKFVRFLYYAFKVVGVAACVFTSGLNLTLVYMRQDMRLQDRLIRSYLISFGVGGVLAELDTPFAKSNFRALQKWWFKAPFYVFMAWLCFDPDHSRGTVWFFLELAAFIALQAMAAMSVVLNVCLREVLERSGALGKRRSKRSAASRRRRRLGIKSSSLSRGAGTGGGGAGGANAATSSSAGLGVSSFRDRDRRRPNRPLTSPTGIEGGGGFGAEDRDHAPEMVPERAVLSSSSARLASPTASSTYVGVGGGGGGGAGVGGGFAASGRLGSYGAINRSDAGGAGSVGVGVGGVGGVGGGGGLGGGISGKIKWWLDRGGAEEGGASPRGGGRAVVGGTSSPVVSPRSVSTARSGRTNWWEDSDGDDDRASSMVSFSQSDAMSDAGSSVSGMSGGGGWMEGGRYSSSGGGHVPFGGRGTAPLRRAPSVASSTTSSRTGRRSDSRRRFGGGTGSVRGGLEQRPPPLTMQSNAGGGPGVAGGKVGETVGGEREFGAALTGVRGGGGGSAPVPLTAQALARNSGNDGLPPARRSSPFGGLGGGGSNHGGSVAGSVNGGRSGGGGSLQGFGTRRSSRRPSGWDTGGGAGVGGASRASSVSGDGSRGARAGEGTGGAGAGPGWAQGAADYDIGRTASEAGGDHDNGEDVRHHRAGIMDYTPF